MEPRSWRVWPALTMCVKMCAAPGKRNREMSPCYFFHFIKTVKCLSEDSLGCQGELGVSDIKDTFVLFFLGSGVFCITSLINHKINAKMFHNVKKTSVCGGDAVDVWAGPAHPQCLPGPFPDSLF